MYVYMCVNVYLSVNVDVYTYLKYKCTKLTYILLTCTIYVHIHIGIDGQLRLVLLVPFQTEHFICIFVNKPTNENFHLQNEQTENGLGKIAWASVFRLKRQHIYIHSFRYISIYLYL
jgi:hypothetical protein